MTDMARHGGTARQTYRAPGSQSATRQRAEQMRRAARQARQASRAPVRMFYKHPGKLNGAFLANLIILQVFGLIILFSASYATSLNKFGNSYEYVGPQTLYAIVGLAAALLISRVDYHWLRRFAWPLYFVTLGLLVVVLFMPPIKGCRRWINVSGLPTIQVSEIAKFALILLLAHLFARYRNGLRASSPVRAPCRT